MGFSGRLRSIRGALHFKSLCNKAVTQQEGIGFIQYLRQALPEMDRQLDKAQLALEQISSEKGKT